MPLSLSQSFCERKRNPLSHLLCSYHSSVTKSIVWLTVNCKKTPQGLSTSCPEQTRRVLKYPHGSGCGTGARAGHQNARGFICGRVAVRVCVCLSRRLCVCVGKRFDLSVDSLFYDPTLWQGNNGENIRAAFCSRLLRWAHPCLNKAFWLTESCKKKKKHQTGAYKHTC